MNAYQLLYDLMCDLYDESDGDLDAECLAEMAQLDLPQEALEALPSGWLEQEAREMCS